jgi:hypothetical protein
LWANAFACARQVALEFDETDANCGVVDQQVMNDEWCWV